MALPLMMAGCASFPGTTFYLDELKTTTPTGSAFTQALSKEYLAFAESERQQYDWYNSQRFAKKGLDSAHGDVVPPEEPGDWSFDDKAAAADIDKAHGRLVKILATNAPTRVPVLTATAQVKYDCWVEQQYEGWQKDDIAACRKDFIAAADAIEAPAKPVAAHPAPVKPSVAPQVESFQLFFDFNKDKLTPDAAKIVASVAKAAKTAGYPKLVLTGYTDLSGSDSYNQKLSERRAQAVRKALIAAGVPADRLTTLGKGKTSPLIKTADGVKEPQNRRVAVQFPN